MTEIFITVRYFVVKYSVSKALEQHVIIKLSVFGHLNKSNGEALTLTAQADAIQVARRARAVTAEAAVVNSSPNLHSASVEIAGEQVESKDSANTFKYL